MVTRKQLFSLLILGRTECYVKKNPTYNPYVPGDIYDWHFELEQGKYLFTDSYRGFNPYSGVEYIYTKDLREPIWACDYVGNVRMNSFVSEKDIYEFLKKARGIHLLNCGGDLATEYFYKDGEFVYQLRFSGNLNAILQTEEIYYRGTLVGTQVSAGYLKV
ncbi:DUF5680 domain-containing protein [Desulfitobacterium metallireducens]|uniref:DUF5680 domain-containing protein n=1 Tax=Desulfitobacterium metallireducens DSM 15288 TaxID=871968 RepID=W0E911_9FIRM|nr:DUF5680 domain-containing protein [Desulfitobacterium metallireducens]AHF06023.1 hypothetical protein DESME_02300 [Desulfitobacterium metallireducens DSM 15288]